MASPAVDQAPSAELVRRTRRQLRRAGHPGRLARWRTALRGEGGLRILAAVVGGYALNLSFAPTTLWWMAPVGLGLFGLAVHGRRIRPGLGLGLLFGLAFYLPLLNWTTVYVGPVATALAVAEAVLTMPVGALIASASRRLPLWPLWAAAAWIAGEALRARFPFGGFPWGGIAYSQPDGPLLPSASLLGASGLAFLTALTGFALSALARTLWLRRRELRPLVLLGPVVMVAAPFVLGVVGLSTEQSGAGAPRKTIAIVQGNVPEPGLEFNARRRAVTDLHVKETDKLAADVKAGIVPQPDLLLWPENASDIVIWPENSSDIDPLRNPDAAAQIDRAATAIKAPILVGAVLVNPDGQTTTNSALVWQAGVGVIDRNDKRKIQPFGEYMPWRSFFRIFSDKVDLQQGEFLPGQRPGNLTMNGVKIGDVICFEVVYDGIVRDVVKGGAQVLVVQTNNATFGYTNETYQQQAMSRVRAVEHGREVLISSTSGVSAVIRPDGSVESTIGLFTAGYMDPSVPLISATTPGTVLGGPIEWILTIGFLAGLAFVTVLGRRRQGQKMGDATGAESSSGVVTA